MWVTPPRSCCPISRRRSPARSFTSTRASATSWPVACLLLLQTRRTDVDRGALPQAGDIGFVLGAAVDRGDARADLRIDVLRLAFDHLRHPQHQVAFRKGHADVRRQLGSIGGEGPL